MSANINKTLSEHFKEFYDDEFLIEESIIICPKCNRSELSKNLFVITVCESSFNEIDETETY